MKTKITALTLALISLLSYQSVFGQESDTSKSKFGLGVSLFNIVDYEYDYDNAMSSSILLTIDLKDKFRLEPSIAFAIAKGGYQFSANVGAFKVKAISKFKLLYGMRMGYNSERISMIAPAIAGEYYFIDNFSIGTEVQLRLLGDEGFWFMATNSLVIIRFYF